jgi:hypothetical protein
MDFKFFNQENTAVINLNNYWETMTDSFNLTNNNGRIFYMNNQRIQDVEFCFQFDDESPVVFANGPNDCTIHISPTANSNMIFNDNGRVFKIFARQRQND